MDNESLKSDSDDELDLQNHKQQTLNDEDKNEICSYIKNDFMGLYKNNSLEAKKLGILEIYRYFFRFSIERLKNFIDNPIFIVITLQYLKETQMSRVLQRKTLRKNDNAYYRAIENMINLSKFKHQIFKLLPFFINDNTFEIIIEYTF